MVCHVAASSVSCACGSERHLQTRKTKRSLHLSVSRVVVESMQTTSMSGVAALRSAFAAYRSQGDPPSYPEFCACFVETGALCLKLRAEPFMLRHADFTCHCGATASLSDRRGAREPAR